MSPPGLPPTARNRRPPIASLPPPPSLPSGHRLLGARGSDADRLGSHAPPAARAGPPGARNVWLLVACVDRWAVTRGETDFPDALRALNASLPCAPLPGGRAGGRISYADKEE